MKLTKEELASRLNGREYGDEMTVSEEAEAMSAGLVVVFGASDDLCEFRGAIDEEMDACDGGKFYLHRDGILSNPDSEECDKCRKNIVATQKKCAHVEAMWCPKELETSWAMKTDLPCSTFDIMEDGELYCRGIVFNVSDLPRI